MQIVQKFRDHLAPLVTEELEQIIASIREYWGVEHKEDGTHGAVTCDSLTVGGVAVTGGGGGGATTLDSLTDVNTAGAASGNALVYNSGTALWGPGAVGGGGGGNSTSTGTVGSYPATPAAGDLFFQSNSFYLERYSGSAWVPWGPLFPLVPPIDAQFAWVNQGAASVSTASGGIFLRAPASGTKQLRIRKKAAPATPYTVTAAFLPAILGRNFQFGGLCVRNSTAGTVIGFSLYFNGTYGLYITTFSSPTAGVAHLISPTFEVAGLLWLRLTDNGTNRLYSYSRDGVNFIQVYSEGRTVFLTADEVGFFVNDESNHDAGMTLVSWQQT